MAGKRREHLNDVDLTAEEKAARFEKSSKEMNGYIQDRIPAWSGITKESEKDEASGNTDSEKERGGSYNDGIEL